MADDDGGKAAGADARTQIAAIVEPIKAVAGLIGFAIGAYTAHRAGADWADSAIHGIVGAILLSLIGWFAGLVLVREAIRAKIDTERREYDQKVAETRRQIVQTLRERGHDIPDSYLESAPRRPELPSGT